MAKPGVLCRWRRGRALQTGVGASSVRQGYTRMLTVPRIDRNRSQVPACKQACLHAGETGVLQANSCLLLASSPPLREHWVRALLQRQDLLSVTPREPRADGLAVPGRLRLPDVLRHGRLADGLDLLRGAVVGRYRHAPARGLWRVARGGPACPLRGHPCPARWGAAAPRSARISALLPFTPRTSRLLALSSPCSPRRAPPRPLPS